MDGLISSGAFWGAVVLMIAVWFGAIFAEMGEGLKSRGKSK